MAMFMMAGISLPALRGSEKPSTIANQQHPEIGGRDDHVAKTKADAITGACGSERGSDAEATQRRHRGDETKQEARACAKNSLPTILGSSSSPCPHARKHEAPKITMNMV